MYPHKANYHIPNNTGTIITPSMKTECKIFCWYNSKSKKDSDELSTPIKRQLDYNVKSKTIDLEKNKKSTKMAKALLCRSIDNTSPKIDIQIVLFHTMVNKDEVIKAIISVTIEVDASVEFIKKRLMDNCGS